MSKLFGERLRTLRKINSTYTQQGMADLLKISRSTYTYYETGKSEPGQDTLRKICHILHVDYNALLDVNGDFDKNVLTSGDRRQHLVKNLSPDEEQIVLAYRQMDNDEKDFLSRQINNLVKRPRRHL